MMIGWRCEYVGCAPSDTYAGERKQRRNVRKRFKIGSRSSRQPSAKLHPLCVNAGVRTQSQIREITVSSVCSWSWSTGGVSFWLIQIATTNIYCKDACLWVICCWQICGHLVVWRRGKRSWVTNCNWQEHDTGVPPTIRGLLCRCIHRDIFQNIRYSAGSMMKTDAWSDDTALLESVADREASVARRTLWAPLNDLSMAPVVLNNCQVGFVRVVTSHCNIRITKI